MAIIKTKRQIQPDWPLRFDQTMGPYASVDSVAASLKQDFIILLQTIPGEWPMRPDLGVGLVTYTFETMGSEYLLDIKTKIQAQLRKYLPNIKLIDATFNSDDEQIDNYVSVLKIDYFIEDLSLRDSVNFGVLAELINAQNAVAAMVAMDFLSTSKVGRLNQSVFEHLF